MIAHQFARLTILCGLLLVANGCSHCGTCRPGVVDCLFGDSCCDNGCDSGCGGCNQRCGSGCQLRQRMVCAPQFGGEVYQGCSCGDAYYGDWKSHPPCADPCDCYGNNTGCANSCQDCSHLNRGRYCGLKGILKSALHCDGCDECDSCNTCTSGGCASGGHGKAGCKSCGY